MVAANARVHFRVVHKPGDRMKHVDALSRNPVILQITEADWVLLGQTA